MPDFLQSRTLAVAGAALPVFNGKPVLVPARLSGTETLGELFCYTLELKTVDMLAFSPSITANVDLDKLIGAEVTVLVQIEGIGIFVPGMPGNTGTGNIGAGTREITGLVTSARFVREEGRAMVYELTLRPWLWLATKNQDCRLFQDMDVMEITDAVLSAYMFPVEKWLVGNYPRRDIQRQNWESDFGFVCRLWQEWGIYFWFEHGNGHHRLILCDSIGAHRPHGEAYRAIQYKAPGAKRIDQEHIHELSVENHLTTGRATSVDYDYTTPRADLTSRDEDPRDTSHAGQEHYGWGDYAQPQAGVSGLSGEHNDAQREADYLVRVRMDALRCAGLRVKGTGNMRGLVTGQTFTLEHHPQQAANREYLVVSSALTIEEVAQASGVGQHYRCTTEFEIQPTSEMFRPAQTLTKPRTSGPEYAIVTGPADQEIWTDAYGRVKVRFLWDRSAARDHTSSCWVRVSSPWQGNQFGATHLPRIGQEVLVEHIHGDPDLPVVTGRVVNAFNQPAWALPDNQALSGFRSRGLKCGQSNHFVQDDTSGEIQTQLSCDYGTSQLSLGFVRRILGNKGRQDARGKGFDLRTDLWGVVRAAMGLLITTEARNGAQSHAKDMGETVQRLTQARDIHVSLTRLAQKHDAQQADADQSEVTNAIKAQNDAIRGGTPTSDDPHPEMSTPHVVVASPAGIETTTAGSTHIASDENLALTTGGHVGIAARKSLYASVAEAFSLFVHKLGIKLVAASGKVRIEAQGDNVEIVAKKVLELMSTTDWINVTAKHGIRLNGGGTELEISSKGILGFTDGQFLVHANDHATDAPQSKPADFPSFPSGKVNQAFPFSL
ncbi:type VI secretion system Vgr family protein [Burkholderia diffusa]|uniref:type VI secretion system Vgr family protein n=1 Tax=Burkholderia diffusa TaxID=488732 RepID=UPI000758221A|nr:type VI secretion system Vgr family protein [Burkholderia diffusa]KVC43421.1 type VI secretion protein ImpA [Burkholderia diffusa]